MKTAFKIYSLVTLAIFLAAGTALAARHGQGDCGNRAYSLQGQRGAAGIAAMPYETPDAEETEGILKMREEEKLARDVYITLNEQWNMAVFTNIAGSEQRHMDAVKALIDKYGMEDPVVDDTVGVFQDPAMQALYNQLTAQGSESAEKALWVGATIEDLDIFDLNELIDTTDNEDILTVYQNLVKGSRNHLRAFGAMLATYGETYEAQFLTQEEVDAIINSDRETGRYDADGNPVSNGQGMNRTRRGGTSNNGRVPECEDAR